MAIEKLLKTFREDRKKYEFLYDEDHECIEVVGKAEGNGNDTEPAWALLTSANFARINVGKGSQYLMLYRNESNHEDKEVSYGIYFVYDPEVVVRDISYDESTGKLTITVSKDAGMYFYNSESKEVYFQSFSQWSGELEKPVRESEVLSMDSRSPTHEKSGIGGLGNFGQI